MLAVTQLYFVLGDHAQRLMPFHSSVSQSTDHLCCCLCLLFPDPIPGVRGSSSETENTFISALISRHYYIAWLCLFSPWWS